MMMIHEVSPADIVECNELPGRLYFSVLCSFLFLNPAAPLSLHIRGIRKQAFYFYPLVGLEFAKSQTAHVQ